MTSDTRNQTASQETFQSHIEVTVRYAETDQMGVVHHAVYPIYFEIGRTDFFARHIMPYSHMESLGVWAPVIEFSCSIYGKASYEDILRITTIPSAFAGNRIRLDYLVCREDEAIASGNSVHTFISPDRKLLRIQRFPEIHRPILKVFPSCETKENSLSKRMSVRKNQVL